MKERIYKRLTFDTGRQAVFTEFLPDEKFREKAEEAIRVASWSKVPNPKFSNYFVRGSIGTLSGLSLPTGNDEYGHHQALHCEEDAVAVLRSANPEALKNPSEIILAFATKKEEPGSITPCGNCRDILRDGFGEDFQFVVGSTNSKMVVVARMRELLFSDYRKLMRPSSMPKGHGKSLDILWQKIVKEGKRIECDPYATPNPFAPRAVHPERRYFACITTKSNAYFGAHYVRCEYHPVYAGEIAGIRVELARDYSPISAVYFARETESDVPPDVMYRDRQHLMELTFGRELVLGREINPPVYLGTVWNGKTTNLWRTSAKEWLPDVFSPRNFGGEYVNYLREYHKKRAGLHANL